MVRNTWYILILWRKNHINSDTYVCQCYFSCNVLDEDIIVKKDGMEVVVDESSLELIKGSTIDYTQELIRSAFSVVNNPQSESACGCGSSFAIKNFEANPAIDWFLSRRPSIDYVESISHSLYRFQMNQYCSKRHESVQ